MAVQSATYADIHLSEEDIKSRYIQPALEDKGWDKYHMRLEFPYTAGQIVVQGSLKHRKRGKRVDYLLYSEDNYPIAVVSITCYIPRITIPLPLSRQRIENMPLPTAFSRLLTTHTTWTCLLPTLPMARSLWSTT